MRSGRAIPAPVPLIDLPRAALADHRELGTEGAERVPDGDVGRLRRLLEDRRGLDHARRHDRPARRGRPAELDGLDRQGMSRVGVSGVVLAGVEQLLDVDVDLLPGRSADHVVLVERGDGGRISRVDQRARPAPVRAATVASATTASSAATGSRVVVGAIVVVAPLGRRRRRRSRDGDESGTVEPGGAAEAEAVASAPSRSSRSARSLPRHVSACSISRYSLGHPLLASPARPPARLVDERRWPAERSTW